MKFQQDSGRPPYLNRRDQYRLLAMVGVLCVVMVAINLAAKPGSWHWLVPPEQATDHTAPPLEELDFRVESTPTSTLRDDAFRVVETEETDDTASDEFDRDAVDIEIPSDVLEPIEDNTVGLRRAESPAYRMMLSRIDGLPDDLIARSGRDDVAFTVLMLQSDDYRGQLITVRGDLRRLTKFPPPKDSEFETLYEGWLFTRDSGTNPYRVVFTQPPDDVPLDESLNPPVRVEVTGYFFKRYGYASQGGQHVAPLLLAKRPEVIAAPQVIPVDRSELRNMMLTAVGVVGVIVVGLLVWFARSDRRFRESRLSQLAAARLDASPDDLAALQDAPIVDTDRPFADVDESLESSPPVS